MESNIRSNIGGKESHAKCKHILSSPISYFDTFYIDCEVKVVYYVICYQNGTIHIGVNNDREMKLEREFKGQVVQTVGSAKGGHFDHEDQVLYLFDSNGNISVIKFDKDPVKMDLKVLKYEKTGEDLISLSTIRRKHESVLVLIRPDKL